LFSRDAEKLNPRHKRLRVASRAHVLFSF
jgi:hypothetical protein